MPSKSRWCYFLPSSDDVVEYDDRVASMFDELHVASLVFDVVVEQQLDLDRKTSLLLHPMAW